ncbi:hydroxypyruvate isomerase family protein [Paracoccus laeviglucosivorans]|uniref:Hydroxypyruvate isomerase n=1 Tax=Paracoccus laeviglucosivorans TaxID=1197861 RepID=A0A521ECN6_9RHOB|nr:TIM barrel protein [Paracoccus laeviglucosivorans]SMO81683.1 hydroxypyruvate isomerase [Paracoccus laeviglucosivorans]
MTDFSEQGGMSHGMTRRGLFQGSAALGVSAMGMGFATAALAQDAPVLKGNINHSVARWTYKDLSIQDLCEMGKRVGLKAIDLCGPEDWPALKAAGLDSSMCNGAEISLEDGWAEPANHAELVERYTRHIKLVADAGYTNLICFSGNRRGMSDETGLANCEAGLRQILPVAEAAGVTLVMELLNSRVNHPDYMCDRSAWGVALSQRLGTPHFKLLYDIYHMQIMEGDVIRTITDHHPHFGHYHTAGNPGRHEPDDTQELNYPAICRAILATGFQGYVAQEFVPTAKEPQAAETALRDAVLTCDV